jgi:phage terminase small subunit
MKAVQSVADRLPPAPQHLKEATQAWFNEVVRTFILEQHHVRLLTAACQAWDSMETARAAIAEHGQTFTDQNGCPKARPEIQIERDSRLAFVRIVRELDLDTIAPPAEISVRPPALRSNRRGF